MNYITFELGELAEDYFNEREMALKMEEYYNYDDGIEELQFFGISLGSYGMNQDTMSVYYADEIEVDRIEGYLYLVKQ